MSDELNELREKLLKVDQMLGEVIAVAEGAVGMAGRVKAGLFEKYLIWQLGGLSHYRESWALSLSFLDLELEENVEEEEDVEE